MDMELKEKFLALYPKYFNDSPLPVAFFYTDREVGAKLVPPKSHDCIIDALTKAREGVPTRLDAESITCKGGNRCLGFSQELSPDFEKYMTEVRRLKKSPELVRAMLSHSVAFKAPAKFAVFKRWDALQEGDDPAVVFFFSTADVISGLVTLANFDEAASAVYISTAAGCSSITQGPYLECKSEHPRCAVGMFDISARPFVPKETLSFAAPMVKFAKMVRNMEGSFLTTKEWAKIQERIGSGTKPGL